MPKIIKTNNKSGKQQNKIITYILSSVKGIVLFIIGLIILSLVILNNPSESLFVYVFSYILIALGGFTSGYSAYKSLRGRGFLNGIVAASIYMCFLLILIVVLMKFQVKTNVLLIIPICVISGFLGGTIGANT